MAPKITIPHGSPFTIYNIPFGVITTKDNERARCASAIGDFAIDLDIYTRLGHLDHLDPLSFGSSSKQAVFNQASLNAFAALPRAIRAQVRQHIIEDITRDGMPEKCLIKLEDVTMHRPMQIGGYSDFYCSLEHCQNCSPMAAGAAIPKNWFYAPSVYNSRVSSIITSPQPVRRPRGVYFQDDSTPVYGPSQEIDYELEMGYFVSEPVPFGTELDIADAAEHIFGFVLLNDWSARDLQIFEMKPLGPFHSKGFGTSISPWIVTMEALQPFRCSPKTKQDPPPFDHLKWPTEEDGAIDIKLKVLLKRAGKTFQLGTSNLKYLYWTPFQQITHHASAMCGLQTGDLMGTGTISGDGVDERGQKNELGCLYEATQAGTKEVTLTDMTMMKYLADGDEIILQAWCGDAEGGQVSLGFGDCMGKLLPALGS